MKRCNETCTNIPTAGETIPFENLYCIKYTKPDGFTNSSLMCIIYFEHK